MPRRGTPDLRARREAEQAERRQRGGPRYRVQRIPWWFAAFFDRLSPAVIVGLLLVVALVGGLMAVRSGVQNRDEALAAGQPEIYEPVSYEGDVSPRWGLPIKAMERSRWSRYGTPLHVGPRGVPLVEKPGGEVRELTELELDFPYDAEYLPVSGVSGVVYAPGATGYGVRWREPDKMRDVPPIRAVDRVTWFTEQERRLREASRDVRLSVMQVAYVPASSWDRQWAEGLRATVKAINDTYVNGDRDQWAIAGYYVRCDPQLDLEYRSGVTQGCPSGAYRDAVAEVWASLGEVVEVTRRVAEAELLESDRRFTRFYEDANIEEYQLKQVGILENSVERAGASMERLKVYGEAEGFHINVSFD